MTPLATFRRRHAIHYLAQATRLEELLREGQIATAVASWGRVGPQVLEAQLHARDAAPDLLGQFNLIAIGRYFLPPAVFVRWATDDINQAGDDPVATAHAAGRLALAYAEVGNRPAALATFFQAIRYLAGLGPDERDRAGYLASVALDIAFEENDPRLDEWAALVANWAGADAHSRTRQLLVVARRAARDGLSDWRPTVEDAIALAEQHGCHTCAGMAHAVAGKLHCMYGHDYRASAESYGRAITHYAIAGLASVVAFCARVFLDRDAGFEVTHDVAERLADARHRLAGCLHSDDDRRAAAELAAGHGWCLNELGRPDDARAALAGALAEARLLAPEMLRRVHQNAAMADYRAARQRIAERRSLADRRAAASPGGVARWDDETRELYVKSCELYESAFEHATKAGVDELASVAELAAVITFEAINQELSVSDRYCPGVDLAALLDQRGEHLPPYMHAYRDRVLAEVARRSVARPASHDGDGPASHDG